MKDEYYSNTEARINTVMDTRAADFWIQIKRCRDYYELEINPDYTGVHEFTNYLLEQWGIRFENPPNSDMIAGANIIDEAKYALFLLKFT